MGRLNDLSLVTQVAVFHNRRAFDQLVREYQSPVRRFFLSQTMGNEALSDDLAQDTFLKAYTHIGQFRGTSNFLTWLTRIAYNVWYDYCRSEKGKVKTGRKFFTFRSSLFTENGPLHLPRPTAGGRAYLYNLATHRRLPDRRDCRDYENADRDGEIAPETRQGEIG